MTWQRIALSAAPPQAWRNGGGITHELATWPSAEDWRWRVSVARIDRDGPFSAFDGVQRWFAVLSGDGVNLSWPTHQVALTPQSAPLAFAGSPACEAKLTGGPTLDFNLMARGLRGELRRQTSTATQATWPAHAHVGVFACTDCVWHFEAQRIEHPPYSLHWTYLDHTSSWSWVQGEALIFVLQEEHGT